MRSHVHTSARAGWVEKSNVKPMTLPIAATGHEHDKLGAEVLTTPVPFRRSTLPGERFADEAKFGCFN